MTTDMTTGKTLFVLAVVLGCFAVLWPKIFYPMMFEPHDKKIKPDHLPRPGPEFGHPALRADRGRPIFPGEEGRTLRRTIDKDLKPGPVPGMRPSMGGPGIQPQASQRSQGPMGVLMPLYTIGIVVFFVYTVMKIIFKKKDETEEFEQQAKLAQQYARLDPSALNTPEDNKLYQKLVTQRAQTLTDPSSSYHHNIQKISAFEPVKKTEEILEPKKLEEVSIAEEKPKMVEKEKVSSSDARDDEILLLKLRLKETEQAMKQIFDQMAKLTPKIPEGDSTEKVSSTEEPETAAAETEEENSSTESETVESETTTKHSDEQKQESEFANDDETEKDSDDGDPSECVQCKNEVEEISGQIQVS